LVGWLVGWLVGRPIFFRLFVICDGSLMIDFKNSSNFSFSFCLISTRGLVVSEPKTAEGECAVGFTGLY
jgi:hypothetical protein